MSDPVGEFTIREPEQLREMAEFYGNRPCVPLGSLPNMAEMSQGECADLSVALAGAADEIERLRKIEAAAKNVSDTLEGGFVVCRVCGDQETTSDIDFAAELRAALTR